MKKIIALFGALLIALTLSTTVANAASKTEKCNPKAAYTEVIKHPAVIKHHDEVPAVTKDSDTWYLYNPAVDDDEDVTTGYPVGNKKADKANGWQVDSGSHTGQYADPNFKVGAPWQEGEGGGSWFFVSRSEIVVIPEIAAYDEVVHQEATEVITHEAVKCNEKPVTHSTTTFEPAPVPTVKPKHVVIPTLVHAGL